MKHKIFIILFFSSINVFAQTLCRTDIMDGEKLIPTSHLIVYRKLDFSSLWLKTENRFIYGIIGDDNQRISVKILSVEKGKKNPNEYLVHGKSSVKGNVCDFSGKITLQKIQVSKRSNFGVDNEFKGQSKTQGLLTAKYEFFEKNDQKHSGVFEGELKTKWYLNKKDQLKYDDINTHSDSYFNNAFVGYWKMYDSTVSKKCNWGDFRVPNVDCNFDIGVANFSVSEKFRDKGWLDKSIKNGKEWWQ